MMVQAPISMKICVDSNNRAAEEIREHEIRTTPSPRVVLICMIIQLLGGRLAARVPLISIKIKLETSLTTTNRASIRSEIFNLLKTYRYLRVRRVNNLLTKNTNYLKKWRASTQAPTSRPTRLSSPPLSHLKAEPTARKQWLRPKI